MTEVRSQDPALLPAELRAFVTEFSIALNRHAMYPNGHPSVEEAAGRVLARLEALLAERPSLTIGVARRQLVIEGVATDPAQPVFRGLAERLRRQHLGAIRLSAGLTAEELLAVLRLLSAEPDPGGKPLGLGDPERLRSWAHARLYSLTYDRLELKKEWIAPEGGKQDQAARAAELWLGLAHAALAAVELESADDPRLTDPSAVARAINDHGPGSAYDQAVVGYLLRIAGELKDRDQGDAVLRRRVARLISDLHPDALRRLVGMGGDVAQRRGFILDALEGFTVEAVVCLVQAMAEVSGQVMSRSLLRLLSKLAAHVERGMQPLSGIAEDELRDQIRILVADWSLGDPNPRPYTRALEELAAREAPPGERTLSSDTERLLAMCIEIGITGDRLTGALDRMIGEGRLGRLLELLEQTPGGEVREEAWRHLARPEEIGRLLRAPEPDLDRLDPLLERAGPAAAEPLLDLLSDSPSRNTRRAAFDRLARLGPEAGPAIAARLGDDRWFVRRNLLALLGEVGYWPPDEAFPPYAKHPDPRVRHEAFKLWFRFGRREEALFAALADTDRRILWMAASNAAQGDCPAVAVPLLVSRLGDHRLPDELRALAARALRDVRSPPALTALLRVASPGKTFLGRPKIAPTSAAVLAALNVLSTTWASDRRVARVLARARASKDPEIRAAATSPSAAP